MGASLGIRELWLEKVHLSLVYYYKVDAAQVERPTTTSSCSLARLSETQRCSCCIKSMHFHATLVKLRRYEMTFVIECILREATTKQTSKCKTARVPRAPRGCKGSSRWSSTGGSWKAQGWPELQAQIRIFSITINHFVNTHSTTRVRTSPQLGLSVATPLHQVNRVYGNSSTKRDPSSLFPPPQSRSHGQPLFESGNPQACIITIQTINFQTRRWFQMPTDMSTVLRRGFSGTTAPGQDQD